MDENTKPRFTSSTQNPADRLSSDQHGVLSLSDYRKRRAELLDQQGRDALLGVGGPEKSRTGTPDTSDDARPAKKKKKNKAKSVLSFGDDEDEDEDAGPTQKHDRTDAASKRKKIVANANVGFVPKALTKAALRREATEREALRRDFLAMQAAVKEAEIAVPFVFYDGTNIPGGVARMKKGDFIWLFLDKSRKVGASLNVGEKANTRKEWARISVDDLMLVRGTMIIPQVSLLAF